MYLNRVKPYVPFKSITATFIYWSYSFVPTFKKIGFYCDDESIKKPFIGDTIHFILLFTILLLIFPLVIYVSEILSRKLTNEGFIGYFKIHILLGKYYSGFLFVFGFVEVIKFSYTELRPHFIASCVPDMTNIKCSEGLITDYNCTAPEISNLLKSDMYKSFPSGHAALTLYSFIFIMVFINIKMKTFPSPLYLWWLRSISVIIFIWTIGCCVSRILDNRHFWWDVLAGALIGTIGGIIMVRISVKAALREKL